ncbi:MAG: hypothetical protein ACRC68_12540 [Clostridium sp.]
MSNVFVDNKDVNVSCSPFAVFPNEQAILKIKQEFHFSKVELEKIAAIDIELLQAVRVLRYSTSRQLTEYLNKYRGIDIHQRDIKQMLNSKYMRQRIVARYSFTSDTRTEEAGTKVYVLVENGRNILKSTAFGCDWVRTDSFSTEYIKKYLARNQFILKFIEFFNLDDIDWKTNVVGVLGSFSFNHNKYHIVPVRRVGFYQNDTNTIFKNLYDNNQYDSEDKILIIGEDDDNTFEIFRLLIKNRKMNENIVFSQDNRIFSLDFNEAFMKFNIVKNNGATNVELEQCTL